MECIELDCVAPRLIEEALDDPNGLIGVKAFEAPYPGSNNKVQLIWLPAIKMGGAVLVGNGESGSTAWYSGDSPEEVLAKFVNGDEQDLPEFRCFSDAMEWLANVLCVSEDGAMWVYQNTGCPRWDDPMFCRYPFLCDPAIDDIPKYFAL